MKGLTDYRGLKISKSGYQFDNDDHSIEVVDDDPTFKLKQFQALSKITS